MSPAAKKKVKLDEATQAEIGRFMQASYAVEKGILEAIGLLKARKVQFADGDETRLINATIPELEAKLAKNDARRLAFIGGLQAIQPPTAADVQQAKKLSNELDDLIAENARATKVVRLVTKLARLAA